jgi:hypothetical protein
MIENIISSIGSGAGADNKHSKNNNNNNNNKKGKAKAQKTQSRFLKTFRLSFITLVGFVITTTTYSLSKYSPIIPQVDNNEPENTKNTSINNVVGGSACLLIKDDNSRLIEWLAYHYTMLPLRHLIVAVDPDSKTTPLSVLKRWDNTDLNYMIWKDNDYMDPLTMMKRRMAFENKINLTIDETTNLLTQKEVLNEQNLTSLYIGIHRERQRQFLSGCYRHHKLMNHTWVLHIDTDEYILFNTIPDEDKNDEPTVDEYDNYLTPKSGRSTLPKLGTAGDNNKTIIDLLDKRRNISPCMGMIRLLFGDKISTIPVEQEYYSNKTTTIANNIFDLNSFDTLKFNHHHMKGLYEETPKINGLGKVIVDVSQMSYNEMDKTELYSIHRPILNECPGDWMGPAAYVDSLLRVNHYLGSWEAYTARIDVRRSREVFNYRANTDHGPSYDIRPWLESFVNYVGTKEAVRLLNGIGEPFVSKSTISAVSTSSSSSSHIAKAGAEKTAAAALASETAGSGWPPKKTCALLFFGIGRKFKDVSYPSIKTNILDINPDCDIFVHTYDIKEAQGSRIGEGEGDATGTGTSEGSTSINSKELFLLVNGNNGGNKDDGAILDGKIKFETESDFARQRNYKKYRNYFPKSSAWEFPSSMDNMIRQWHSIAGVWRLMRIKETQIHKRYDRVGLFRPDVFYTHPISIMGDNNNATENEHAVIPSMMYYCTRWCGYNDRMFYGKY